MQVFSPYCGLSPATTLNDVNFSFPANATDSLHFVAPPNARGSLDIVWAGLSTIAICVYKVLHLSVPEPTYRQKHWAIKALNLRTVKWSVVAIIAPELLLATSAIELHQARKMLKKLRGHFGKKCNGWTLTHMFYAAMGGFTVHEHRCQEPLTGYGLVQGLILGKYKEDPPLTEDDIKERSENDTFTMILAMLQIVWFYVEFFVRIGTHQEISQFELGIAAIAVCSLLSYGLLWKSPKGVESRTPIEKSEHLDISMEAACSQPCESGGVLGWPSCGCRSIETHTESVQRRFAAYDIPETGLAGKTQYRHFLQLWADKDEQGKLLHRTKACSFAEAMRSDDDYLFYGVMLFVAASVPVGVIHACGWWIAFPTDFDMWLWRLSSLIVTVGGPIFLGGFYFVTLILQTLDTIEPRRWNWLHSKLISALYALREIGGHAVVFSYAFVRLVLIVEMIRCLFYLPVGVFEATSWVSAIPHFG